MVWTPLLGGRAALGASAAVFSLAGVGGAVGSSSGAHGAEAVNAAGRLDTTFGRAGVVRTSFGPGASGGVRELLVDRQDRIVAVGSVVADEAAAQGVPSRDVALVRYLPSGALDRRFGENGKAIHDVRGKDDVATDAVQLPDGRIVVVGATDSDSTADRQDLLVLRFSPDGTLDRSFGTNGVVAGDLSAASPDLDFGFGVAVQRDGRIVVVGQASLVGTARVALAVARFLPDGRRDDAFGTLGVVRPGTGPPRIGHAVLVRPDGRIVVGGDDGSSGGRTYVARLHPNGQLDGTFGRAGFAQLPTGSVRAVLPAAGGAVLAVGAATGRRASAFVLRLNGRGRMDRSFGVGGRVDAPVAAGQTWFGASAGAVQRDGKILAAGGNGDDILVARFSRDGRLDQGFGGTGVVTIDAGRREYASAVAVDRSGKIVAAGDTSRQSFSLVESVLVRLVGTGGAGTRYAAMSAENLAAGVALRWRTSKEPDVRGFVVYRSTSDEPAARKRLTAAPLPARRRPARYSFVDRYPPDYAPLYWLEELRRDGSRALFGPISPGQTPTAGGRPGG